MVPQVTPGFTWPETICAIICTGTFHKYVWNYSACLCEHLNNMAFWQTFCFSMCNIILWSWFTICYSVVAGLTGKHRHKKKGRHMEVHELPGYSLGYSPSSSAVWSLKPAWRCDYSTSRRNIMGHLGSGKMFIIRDLCLDYTPPNMELSPDS
jgi:hypothetical protein